MDTIKIPLIEDTRVVIIRKLVWCLLPFGLVAACKSKTVYVPLPVEDDRVTIDVETLKDTRVGFFSVELNRKAVTFFVVRLGDSFESFLDACKKCYPHKRGYRVDDVYFECRSCKVRYPLDSLKTGVGSCYPVPIKGTLHGHEYRIQLKDLEKAKKYF